MGRVDALHPSSAPAQRLALFEGAFRPFFLATALWAAAALALWLAAWWRGAPVLPGGWPGSWWHAHEMLFGVMGGAAAGFLLTAVPVWTGSPPIRGAVLGGLLALWVAGRGVMLAAGGLPGPLVLGVEVAFFPVVAVVLGRRIAAARLARNAGFPVLLLWLGGLDLLVHLDVLGASGPLRGAAPTALRAGVDLGVLLVVIVGGRITPFFTANALRRQGDPAQPRPGREWGLLGIAAVLALAAGDLLAPRSIATGTAAGVGAAALLLRQAGWRGARVARDPLLLSLHLGLLWVPIGLALVAAGDLTGRVPPAAGLHALTAGALGTTILAVVTRVSLGHTGRPLVAPPSAVAAYLLAHVGAALRVASPFAPVELYAPLVAAGGALWSAAFLVFAVGYAPILLRPRADGLPG